MCSVLLSIHPEHVNNIFIGKKKYEYRKVCCKSNIDRIFIYSTNPVKKVVGEAEVTDVIIGQPNSVWEETKELSGINKEFFDEYYYCSKKAVAFQLGKIIKYDTPKSLEQFGIQNAPQSFIYI